jgi:DNA-binding response OmpR family regulator
MEPGPPTLRLLVVDDDARYGRTLTHLLERVAAVEWCSTAASALARVAEGGVDWVLLDVGLPDASGFDVLSALRARFPTVRVAIHSGLALADGRRRAIEGGAADLLEKPLSLPALVALMTGNPRG